MSSLATTPTLSAPSPTATYDHTTDVAGRVALAEKQINTVLIWTVGMFCIMSWDWLASLPLEAARIWRQRFTPTSYLYLLNRYYGLLQFALVIPSLSGAISNSVCIDHKFFLWQTVGTLISTMIIQLILFMRVASLYRNHLALWISVGILYAAEFGIMVFQAVAADIIVPVPEGAWPCLSIDPHDWNLVVYGMHLVFYSLVLILFMSRPQCFKAPIESGLLVFATIWAMNLINCVTLAVFVPSLQWVNVPATGMLGIVMSCKLILDEPARISSDVSPYASVKPPRFDAHVNGTTAGPGSNRNSGSPSQRVKMLSKIQETSAEVHEDEARDGRV